MTGQILGWLKESIYEYEKALGVVSQAEVDKRLVSLNEMWSASSPAHFKEAMTMAQFPIYFGTILNRAFVKAYEVQQGTWKQYTYADTAPDFRDISRLRMDWVLPLHLRREKAESKAGYAVENELHFGVDEYSTQFDISWQTLQNDDLGELKRAPEELLKAALMFEDMFVSNLYDNAVTQATILALGAPWSGTGVLTAANLAIGINAMMSRTTPITLYPLNLRKLYLVIPPILKLQADVILGSALMAGVATNDKNVLPGYIAGVYTDPYITTAVPVVPWYLFADPNEVAAVRVARLQGAPGPFTYIDESSIKLISGSAPASFGIGSFATGDIQYAVSDIIGGWDSGTLGGVTDFRGFYFSNGTTP
jgi:hypothetical protein